MHRSLAKSSMAAIRIDPSAAKDEGATRASVVDIAPNAREVYRDITM